MFDSLRRAMSARANGLFFNEERRARILKSMANSYYEDLASDITVFDSNRNWCRDLSDIAQLFPDAKCICSVRSIAWILDSLERLVQRNAFQLTRMIESETGNVYTRVETLTKGFVGASEAALRQAWYGEHANRLIAIRYESLTKSPKQVIARLYELIGEPEFSHDFEHVEFDSPDFDRLTGLPGMHYVRPRVEALARETILPPDIFRRFDTEFWNNPGQNPRGVTVL